MKVLFAVSNENISESIIKKYQKNFKEIISTKNVYYFNAIQKELQKDNTYDRIVISEDLEPFANNNYDAIDRFIFDKLDVISDEAINSRRGDTPIILICSDRRNKSEDFLVKLFSIGVYDAVLGDDRSIDQICNLIKKPRTKKEAKVYYKIDTDDVKYSSESENEVSEVEIQNILNHYKKLGKNEEKYAESFESIASQYNQEQLKLIANILPLNVKAVLETTSPSYQKIMTSSVSGMIKQQEEQNGISVNFINDKNLPSSDNIIIPKAINKTRTRKVVKTSEIAEKKEPKFEMLDEDEYSNKSGNKKMVFNYETNTYEEIEEQQKKGRGRPKKNVEISDIDITKEQPKKGRGRPKKTQNIEEDSINNTTSNDKQNLETPNLFDLSTDENNDINTNTNTNTDSSLNPNSDFLPGFEQNNSNNIYNNKSMEDNFTKSAISNDSINTDRFEYNNSNNELTNTQNFDVDIQGLLTYNKKLVAFVGTSKNGTSFIVNNTAEILSQMGIKTAILDTTKNKNSYYIYTQNEEQLRKVAAGSIRNLQSGLAQGIIVNKNLTVYTGIPEENVGINNYKVIIHNLLKNYDLVLIDCDFDTPEGYFSEAQETYLVQSLDVLTIQPLTSFLRDLKAKNILSQDKIRIIINKNMNVRGLTDKAIIGGMSYYNEPSMSFMTELFNRDTVRYCTIPFEQQTYSKYLEGLVNCKISLNGYSKIFMQSLSYLANMVYPLLNSKNNKKNNMVKQPRQTQTYSETRFSQGMNDTLNQMKRNY